MLLDTEHRGGECIIYMFAHIHVHVYAAKYYVTEGKHLRRLKYLGRI